MCRTLSACWILLLTVLLGASPRAGVLGMPAAPGTVRPSEAGVLSEAYCVRVTAKAYHTLEIRSPTDRQSSPSGAVRSSADSSLVQVLPPAGVPARGAALPRRQALHFPLFPTGPPSDS